LPRARHCAACMSMNASSSVCTWQGSTTLSTSTST
jgi:hypothetical protein